MIPDSITQRENSARIKSEFSNKKPPSTAATATTAARTFPNGFAQTRGR